MSFKTLLNTAVACAVSMTIAQAQAEVIRGGIVGIEAGDTLIVQTEQEKFTAHLFAIDTPAICQEFGQEAKDMLSDVLIGKEAKIQFVEPEQDGQAEPMKFVQIAVGEIDVGLYLLERGYAWYDNRYASSLSADWRWAYEKSEQQAKAERIGLWSSIRPVPPWTWRKLKSEAEAAQELARKQALTLANANKELTQKIETIKEAAAENKPEKPAEDLPEKKESWYVMISDVVVGVCRWIMALLHAIVTFGRY